MIAGPNGSGKTTLTRHLQTSGFDLGEYINADDIAGTLDGDPVQTSREAQRLAEIARQSCMARGVNFAFETVMSHPSKVELLKQAKELGYYVILFFVAVDDPRINVDRVAMRVAQGGHDVPIELIFSRYDRTMALLPDAMQASDRSVLFDNSHRDDHGRASLQVLGEVVHGGALGLLWFEPEYDDHGVQVPLPWWAAKALAKGNVGRR